MNEMSRMARAVPQVPSGLTPMALLENSWSQLNRNDAPGPHLGVMTGRRSLPLVRLESSPLATQPNRPGMAQSRPE